MKLYFIAALFVAWQSKGKQFLLMSTDNLLIGILAGQTHRGMAVEKA